MVMKRNKMILVILICVLVICTGIVGAFYLIGGDDSIGEEEIALTAEQYQLLRDSIRPIALEDMCNIERRNAWLILDAMAEANFVESAPQGQSPVSRATWILDMLGVGVIQDISAVRVSEGIHDLADSLILRIVNQEDNIYYIWYQRSLGLGMVTTESEYGEMVYNRVLHIIIDGQICERHSDVCD